MVVRAVLFCAVFLPVFALSLWITHVAVPRGRRVFATRRAARGSKTPSLLKSEAVSDIPVLDQALRPLRFLGALQRRLEQADLELRPVTLLLLGLVSAVAAGHIVSGLLPLSTPAILAVSVVFGLVPYAYVLYRRGRRWSRLEAQLPEALDTVARAIRAGHTLPSALALVANGMAGPLAAEFRRMLVELRFGQPLEKVVSHLAARVPLEEVRFFVAAVLIQKDTGGKLADVLGNLSRILRERFTLRRHVRAVSAQGRLSGIILWVLPVAVALLMLLFNPDYVSILFRERIGRWMLGALLVAQGLGFVLIRKIIRIRV